MTKVWVYAELTGGQVARVSLELLTKARQLTGDVTAIALGSGASAQAATLGQYGAKRVLVHEDAAYEQFLSEPAADTIAGKAGPAFNRHHL
jgi:electron transfer flavoprotein alpha subunit